jgi:hypothetical protein
MTKADQKKINTFRHPHRRINAKFTYRVGIKRNLSFVDIVWLNDNTTGKYSVDKISLTQRNVSFEVANDAVLFKLTHSGDLTCPPFEG